MNRATFRKIACLTLVLAMLVSAVAMMTVTASAETVAVEKTAPEIVVKGEVDVWDKTTQTEPTQVADDGYYLITNAAEFVWVMNNNKDADANNYRLTINIDMNNGKTSGSKNFEGIFDGDGYTISNFRDVSESVDYYIFGTVTGTIKNLNLASLTMYDQYGKGSKAVIYSLTGDGVVDNCHVQFAEHRVYKGGGVVRYASSNAQITNIITSTIEGYTLKDGYEMGVIVTEATGSVVIANCSNYADVASSGYRQRAGIVSLVRSDEVRVENCNNYGDISTTGASRWESVNAGIVGYINESANDAPLFQINNCANYGNIFCTTEGIVGGIVGMANGAYNGSYVIYTLTLNECFNYGDVSVGNESNTTEIMVGGLVGSSGKSLIVNNSANYGNVYGYGTGTRAGGILGRKNTNQDGSTAIKLFNSANYGDVTSGYVAGGIVGHMGIGWGKGTSAEKAANLGVYLTNSVIAGTISAPTVGGIYGYLTDGTYVGNVVFDSTILASTIVCTSESGQAGILCGYSSYNRADGRFCNSMKVSSSCYIDDNGLTALANAATTSGVATAATNSGYTPSVYNAGGLTDGTYLALLNAYASTNAQMPWVQGDTAPELLVCALELDGANLELSGDLTMNLRLDAAELPAGFTYGNVKLATDDNVYEGNPIGNYYVFAVKDIPAAEMGANRDYHIVVEITTGETTVSYKTLVGKSYSPVTYAQNICKRTDEEATKAQSLLQAMVKYAYYAEVMEDGASSIIENFNAATGLALTSDIGYTATVRDDVDASSLGAYVSIGANLEAGVNLVFQVNDASVTALELTAGGSTKTYQAEGGYIEITDVHAGMLKNKLNIKLLAGDSEIVSATYAIGNYLDSVATSGAYTEAQQNAAMAAAMYMLAVGQYQTPAYYN